MNMWTRSELKERGKAALHRNYWIVVLATLVVTALTGGTGNAAGNGSLQEGSNIAAGNGDAASSLIQTLFSFFGKYMYNGSTSVPFENNEIIFDK